MRSERRWVPDGRRVFLIPWYATAFRGDPFEEALREIAPVALRYGATEYWVYRRATTATCSSSTRCSRTTHDFERYWYGPEFSDWRAEYASWYQVPVVYVPMTLVAQRARRPGGQRQRSAAASALLERSHSQPRVVELLPVELGGLLEPAPDHRLAGLVDRVGVGVALLDADARGCSGRA